MPLKLTALLLAVFLTACSGASKELPTPPAADNLAQPESLSWWSRAAMNAFMRWSVWSGNRSGFITLFARDGVLVHSDAVGFKDIASNAPMNVDTHVRIASMTKPITATVAMTLVQEGSLGLDDKVSDYLPEFANLTVANSHEPDAQGNYPARPAQQPLLVRHLLMFSSGIGPGMDKSVPLVQHWDDKGIYQQTTGSLRQRVERLAALPLFEEPGTRWRYGFSADVLAVIVEVITGQPIAQAMRERVFAPLGMENTRYFAPGDDPAPLATVYTQDENGELVEASPAFDRAWTPGGGGLVSTASDYMRFALMLSSGGEYRGIRILEEATLANMVQLHMPDGVLADADIDGLGWGLGMAVVADEDATLTPDRTGDFWWSGYYGTTFLVSPSTGLTAVILTQNEPGEFSGLPYEVYVLQGLALAGL